MKQPGGGSQAPTASRLSRGGGPCRALTSGPVSGWRLDGRGSNDGCSGRSCVVAGEGAFYAAGEGAAGAGEGVAGEGAAGKGSAGVAMAGASVVCLFRFLFFELPLVPGPGLLLRQGRAPQGRGVAAAETSDVWRGMPPYGALLERRSEER